jgi:hypothetical protein
MLPRVDKETYDVDLRAVAAAMAAYGGEARI